MSDAAHPGLGKKILGLFIETDAPRESAASERSTNAASANAQGRGSSAPAPATAPATANANATSLHAGSAFGGARTGGLTGGVSATASVDPEMLATLHKKISARSTPYVSLMDTAQRLVGVIPDETMRLKAAFAMLCGDGSRSVSSITQAMDVHIADLEGERIRFKGVSDDQLVSMAADLRKQAAALAAQNTAGTADIERMQAEIAKLQATMGKNLARSRELNVSADKAEADIKAVSLAFDRAVEYLKNDLMGKKAALNALLS